MHINEIIARLSPEEQKTLATSGLEREIHNAVLDELRIRVALNPDDMDDTGRAEHFKIIADMAEVLKQPFSSHPELDAKVAAMLNDAISEGHVINLGEAA